MIQGLVQNLAQSAANDDCGFTTKDAQLGRTGLANPFGTKDVISSRVAGPIATAGTVKRVNLKVDGRG